jgi:hypothetical protein
MVLSQCCVIVYACASVDLIECMFRKVRTELRRGRYSSYFRQWRINRDNKWMRYRVSKFVGRLNSMFVFDIFQIPSTCSQICSWCSAPTCTPLPWLRAGAQTLPVLTHFSEDDWFNLARDTDYPDFRISVTFSISPGKCCDHVLHATTVVSFPIHIIIFQPVDTS